MNEARFLILALGGAVLLAASEAPARLRGRVVTETNAPINEARVLVSCGEVRAQALSNPEGHFSLDLGSSDKCKLSAEAPGYFPLKDREVDPEAEVRLVLTAVRELFESMDVSGKPVAISLDTSSTEERATGTDLINAPYPGTNNLASALRIMPGVVTGGSANLNINGGASEQTHYTLDGFDVADALTGHFDSRFSIEAVQEVQVNSGPAPAEFGKGSAGTLAIRTRMGTDKVRASVTNFIPGVENRKGLIIGSYTPRINVSGPWSRGRAWWSNSADLQFDQPVVPELPKGQDRTWSLRWSDMFSNQFNLSPTNILYSTSLFSWYQAPKTGLSALVPLEATADRRSDQIFTSLRDQQYIGGGALVEIGYAFNRTWYREIPQGPGPLYYTAAGLSGNWYRDAQQRSERHQLLANGFLPAFTWHGSHIIKTGVDVSHVDYWQDIRRSSYVNLSAAGTPLRETDYWGQGRLSKTNLETSYYVQDSWRIRPNLQIEGGFRADWDQLIGRVNAAPRISAAWSPDKHPNTKISGGVGSIYDASNLQLFVRPFDQIPVVTYFNPDGSILRGPVVAVFEGASERLRSPGFWTYSIGWEQRYPSSLTVKLNYLGKRGLRGLTYFPDLAGAGLPAGLPYPPDTTYRLTNHRQDRFDSFEVTLRQTLRSQYAWMVSYVRSSARSNASQDISVENPQNVPDNSGPLPWDTPHRLLSWGYLPTFWKSWAIAYLAEYHTGFPFSIQAPDGTVYGSVNSYRYPAFFELNLHVEYKFTLLNYRLAVRAGVNNLTGRKNPVVVDPVMGSPNFLTFYGGYGRSVNFRIRWLGRQ